MSTLNDLIDALASDDQELANTHFQSVMADKVQATLDAQKIEVAKGIYGDTFADDDTIDPEEVEVTDEFQTTTQEAE